jgi:hypothetical protein
MNESLQNGARKLAAHATAVFGSLGIASALITIGNYAIDWKLASTQELIRNMSAEWSEQRQLMARRGQELIDVRANERHLEEEITSLHRQIDAMRTQRR